MKIAGRYTIGVSQERAFMLLQDPRVLARAMPGCESLDRVGENEYAMKMNMAGMPGLFECRVRISDCNPPASFRLIVEGNGKAGFMRAEGPLTLTPQGGGCHIHYEGDVQVGGAVAAFGQGLIDTAARMMIQRFFERLSGEAAAMSHFVA